MCTEQITLRITRDPTTSRPADVDLAAMLSAAEVQTIELGNYLRVQLQGAIDEVDDRELSQRAAYGAAMHFAIEPTSASAELKLKVTEAQIAAAANWVFDGTDAAIVQLRMHGDILVVVQQDDDASFRPDGSETQYQTIDERDPTQTAPPRLIKQLARRHQQYRATLGLLK